jgi:response regulator NasT
MTTYGMTEPQAFKWIQRTAMDHRMTMRQVAERIVAESASPSAGPAAAEAPATDPGRGSDTSA